MKKSFLIGMAICASLFVASCSSSDDNGSTPPPPFTPEEIENLPYSELTPAQQKVKLESEATALLEMANDLKNVTMIDAVNNLDYLLGLDSPEFGEVDKSRVSRVEDTFKYADVYGVYEWNPTAQEWKKTASNSELKFIFPATKSGQTNNAALAVNAVASSVKVNNIPLPLSATGILTVNDKQSAKFNMTAEYQGNNQVPSKTNFTIQFDNYEMKFDFIKAAENKFTATWTHKGNLMIQTETGATIDLNKVVNNTVTDLGKANSYIQIMNNFVLYAQIDLDTYNKEMDAAEEDYDEKDEAIWYWNSETDNFQYDKEFYNKRNNLEKSYSESAVSTFNKYMKYTLASIKDGSKIAVLEQKSEKDYTYIVYDVWNETTKRWEASDQPNPDVKIVYYTANSYLKFDDNTEVEAKAYFSTGFDEFIKKWNEFIKNFN